MVAGGPVADRDTARGDIGREEASIGAYDSDHELMSTGAPGESGAGRVEVLTEVRQEVQRIESPGAFARERELGNYTVSTGISATGGT